MDFRGHCFSTVTMRYENLNPLGLLLHETNEFIPEFGRVRVTRRLLRWLLLFEWYLATLDCRQVIKDPQCTQVRPVDQRMKGFKDGISCPVAFSAVTKEVNSHWNECGKSTWPKCTRRVLSITWLILSR
ncbi:unnamed protein product [Rodentolepis nana]|uniref:Uncharacterized protein n=1 Tax=Rodentolepis nana TaxID=102285 RepID=A0A0R3T045_RODNA|nr:unnamed protein product [Rodentolepis nana]